MPEKLKKCMESARKRIERAESLYDPMDAEAWDAFWETEIPRQIRCIEKATNARIY